MKLTFATLLAICSAVRASASSGFARLDFDVLKGNTIDDAHKDNELEFVKRDGSAEMVLTNQNFFYTASLKVGSDEQTVKVLVDTGSSDLWLMGANNIYCEKNGTDPLQNITAVDPLNPFDPANVKIRVNCEKYGTFNQSSSETWNEIHDGKKFAIIYGDKTFAIGPWGKDTIKVGDFQLDQFQFASANQSIQKLGVMGIGLTGLETTSGKETDTYKNTYEYPNFPLALVKQGVTHKNAYSLFLNSKEAASGSILFGAVDHAKYTGDLTLVPILKDQDLPKPISLRVTLNSIDVDGVPVLNKSVSALLDSGTTLTYLESSTVLAIAKQVNAPWNETLGFYARKCPTDDAEKVTFHFQSVNVTVPVKNLMYNAKDNSGNCLLGLVQSDDFNVLGDGFLRSAYIVYNLDDFEIGIAQGVSTEEEDIDVIYSTIPCATSATDYNQTWVYTDKWASWFPSTTANNSSSFATTGSSSSSTYSSASFTGSLDSFMPIVTAAGLERRAEPSSASSSAASNSTAVGAAGNVLPQQLMSMAALLSAVTGVLLAF